MGYVDSLDATNTAYDSTASGLGANNVQSAIDTLASSQAAGLKNYNIISSTTFSTWSTTDVLVTGMTITPSSGTYAVIVSASMQSSGASSLISGSLYKAGSIIADSSRPFRVPGSNTACVYSTLTVSTFNGSQACDLRVNTSSATMTVNQRSMLLIRLGP